MMNQILTKSRGCFFISSSRINLVSIFYFYFNDYNLTTILFLCSVSMLGANLRNFHADNLLLNFWRILLHTLHLKVFPLGQEKKSEDGDCSPTPQLAPRSLLSHFCQLFCHKCSLCVFIIMKIIIVKISLQCVYLDSKIQCSDWIRGRFIQAQIKQY